MKTYENKNAAAVLKNVESMIVDIENGMVYAMSSPSLTGGMIGSPRVSSRT